MTDELKNFRAPEPTTRFLLFAGLVIVFAFAAASNEDYRTAKAIEREYQQAADKRQSRPEPARIWSKKCMEKGKRIYASQADGGKWKVFCVDATARTIKA